MPGDHHASTFTLRNLSSEKVVVVVGRFYVALFSAFEQTHCARISVIQHE